MTASDDDDLFDVVRDVVQQMAPEELPALRVLEQLPRHRVHRALTRGKRRDDPLGFGMGELAAVVTPVVWAAIQQVVDQMATSAAGGAASRVRTLMRRVLRRRGRAAQPLPRFGPAELDAVHSSVEELAAKAGMKSERAELLAYRVVERLKEAGSEEQAS